MKHNFEKWLEIKCENKSISSEVNNIEQIKNVFEESICYKSGAYRAAIVMAMIGFDTIMRDRILKYKNSLEKLNSQISFEKYDLINENDWDKQLMNFIINNDSNFKKIFPNKSQWQLGWKNYRNMRNNAAHGKTYKIDYYDVESFYSWIEQAFNNLYPCTAIETILEQIEIFFDEKRTPKDKPCDDLLNSMSFINSSEDIKNIFDKLRIFHEIYFFTIEDNDPTNKRIIKLISHLYKEKREIVIQIIEMYIEEVVNCNSNNRQYYLLDIFRGNTQILSDINEDLRYQFFKNTNFLLLEDYNYFYGLKLIKDDLISEKLGKFPASKLTGLEKFKNISSLIYDEITKRCKEFENSKDFTKAINNILYIPLEEIDEFQMKIILSAFDKNNQVYNSESVKAILKQREQMLTEKFNNLDLSKLGF